jgi:hypothetical protein
MLLDIRWINLSKIIKNRDNNKCVDCGSTDNLNAHHLYYYVNLTPPWEYPNEALVTVCEKCHLERHKEEIPRVAGGSEDLLNRTDYTKSLTDFISDSGKYTIGNWSFKNKSNIKKHIRSILDVNVDKTLDLILFVQDLFTNHDDYSGKEFANEIDIKIDEQGLYNNFVIIYKDGSTRQFSTNHCINKL